MEVRKEILRSYDRTHRQKFFVVKSLTTGEIVFSLKLMHKTLFSFNDFYLSLLRSYGFIG